MGLFIQEVSNALFFFGLLNAPEIVEKLNQRGKKTDLKSVNRCLEILIDQYDVTRSDVDGYFKTRRTS